MFNFFATVELTDYQGGTNPLLVFIGAAIIGLSLLILAAILIQQQIRQMKVRKVCRSAELNNAELGIMMGFIRRFHVKDPLTVLTQPRYLDGFMNRIAHYFATQKITEEQLTRETDTLSNIRRKLALRHDFKQRQLFSSRAIPEKYPVDIIYTDDDTGETFHFQTKVVVNNELYLGILPPSHEVSKCLPTADRVRFDISFQRGKGVSYGFESRFVRLVNHPETMWYIQHSRELSKTKSARKLNILGTLMICGKAEEDVNEKEELPDEMSALISVLDQRECVVELEAKSIAKGTNILLSFDLKGTPLTLRGLVVQTHTQGTRQAARIQFSDLSPEEYKLLVRFDGQERKKRKQDAAQKHVTG